MNTITTKPSDVSAEDIEQFEALWCAGFDAPKYLASIQCENDADMVALIPSTVRLGQMYERYIGFEGGKELYFQHMECLFRISRLLQAIIEAEPVALAFHQAIQNKIFASIARPRRSEGDASASSSLTST